MNAFSTFLIGLMIAAPAKAGPADALLNAYRAAWDRADAPALAHFYARDGQLHTPYGVTLHGKEQIRSFYMGAFEHGYRGSRGEAALIDTEAVAPGIIFGHGRWSIHGARSEKGEPRAAECGDFFMVLRREGASWRIASLHELGGLCPQPKESKS
jgi:uncharacterized protein (TIGR02246 family)